MLNKTSVPSIIPTELGKTSYGGNVGPMVVLGHCIKRIRCTANIGIHCCSTQDTLLWSTPNLKAKSLCRKLCLSFINTIKSFCDGEKVSPSEGHVFG